MSSRRLSLDREGRRERERARISFVSGRKRNVLVAPRERERESFCSSVGLTLVDFGRRAMEPGRMDVGILAMDIYFPPTCVQQVSRRGLTSLYVCVASSLLDS